MLSNFLKQFYLFTNKYFKKTILLLISIIISSQILFKVFLINEFNHFLIYDEISFENVIFYITKSYSLLNNYSFFFSEEIKTPDFLIGNAIVANIFYSFFLFFFGELTEIVITFAIILILFYLLFINFEKFLNLSFSQNLILVIALIIFLSIGPDSLKTISNYILFSDYKSNLLFRYYSPLITSFFFVIYLHFLKIKKKYEFNFWFYFVSFINIFSYFYSFLIILFLNFFISIRSYKNNKKFFLLINSISFLGFIFYVYLYTEYTNYSEAADIKVFKFNKSYLDFFIQFRDTFVSILILIFGFVFLDKYKIKILKQIYILKLIIYFLNLIDFFLIDLQISMHLSMYYLRPLNWIVLLFIVFNILPKKKFVNYILYFIVIFLNFIFIYQNFNYYKIRSKVENTYLQTQNKIIEDLKDLDKFLAKNQLQKKEIIISEAYTNGIFSSIVKNKEYRKIYIKNPGIFRSNNITLGESINNFISFCKFIDIPENDCYDEFISYKTNSFFNNSFIFTGKRDYEIKNFSDIYNKNFNFDLKDNLFLIYKFSSNYEKIDNKLLSKKFIKIEFIQLVLYY